jgi:hypothetical protein
VEEASGEVMKTHGSFGQRESISTLPPEGPPFLKQSSAESGHTITEMMSEFSKEALFTSIAQALESEEYCNLIIPCKEKTWKVHKVIVCPSSKRIAAEAKPEWQKVRQERAER